MTIHCDNSAIDIFKNLVQYSWTKHIDVQYHFITNLLENHGVSFIPKHHLVIFSTNHSMAFALSSPSEGYECVSHDLLVLLGCAFLFIIHILGVSVYYYIHSRIIF